MSCLDAWFTHSAVSQCILVMTPFFITQTLAYRDENILAGLAGPDLVDHSRVR